MSDQIQRDMMKIMERRVSIAMDAFRWIIGMNTKNHPISTIAPFFQECENVPDNMPKNVPEDNRNA